MSNFRTPPNRRYVRESRPHDFLYDPIYTTPARQDFLKDAEFGMRAGARIKLRPVYNSMFSALKNDPRMIPCMSTMNPNNLDNFLPQYDIGGVPIIPADTGPLPTARLVDDVTGADRAKYATRYAQPRYKLEVPTFDFNRLAPEDQKKLLQNERTRRSGFVNRAIQTDYRESETQTDPYSPPYFLPHPGAYPKLLALVKLTWEKGLPFSLDDIVIIERALSKRMLEYADREVENESDKDFEKRIKLMEELEAQQWADREKELDKLTQRKMELTSRLLQEYSSRVANDHTMRLERLHAILKDKSQKCYQQIKHEYFRDLRKLERKYILKQEPKRRDIIKDHTQFDSSVYAPLARNGPGIDTLNRPPPFAVDIQRDFATLNKVTNDPSFIKHDLTFDVEKFKERVEKCRPTGSLKRLEKKLEDIYLSFKGQGTKTKDHISYYDHLAVRGHEGRPLTPDVIISENKDEELRKPHIILLQKVARGRTIQKLIRNEIDKNMTEILGLKLMYDMDPNCQRLEESQLQKLSSMKRANEAEDTRDTPVEEVVGHLEGETLSKMVDFLDKEMVRLIDERKIHALILMAERERRLKEAAEGGKRFQEEEARRANDEIFKQVTGIHQATVDLYLEEIFLESCDRAADDQSRIYVQKLATTLNDALYSTRHTLSDFEQEELAADLVSSFMMPELHRLYHNSRVDQAGNRFKVASEQVMDAIFSAHPITKQIMDELEPVVDEHLIRGKAALDGGVKIVDEIIAEAVVVALLPLGDGGTEGQDQSTGSQSQEQSSSTKSKSDSHSTPSSDTTKTDSSSVGTKKKSSDKNSGDIFDAMFSFLRKEPPLSFDKKKEVRIMSLEPELDTKEEPTIETVDIVEEEEGEGQDEEEGGFDFIKQIEIGGEDEEEEEEEEEDKSPPPPKLTVQVDDFVVRSLAAKSVQVAHSTEPGQEIERVFDSAIYTVDNLFDDVKRTILPPRMDDSASDATLSDDTDD